MSPLLSWTVILLITVTSVGILLARDWRWLIIFLSAQYIGVFILTLQHWTIGMAAVKIVAGWMGATILGMTRSRLAEEDIQDTLPQGRFFRIIAAGVVGLIAFSSAPFVDVMMADAGITLSAGGILLIGMGLLHLGVTAQPMRVILGLMTVISGFEVIHSAVESSVLLAALLVVINLGLALTGSYLMLASSAGEDNETETA